MRFPLHRTRTPATRIKVRPWAPKSWPTVWSQHEFRGATVRLKQLVGPWGPSSFPPLLNYLAGNPGAGGDRLYAPPLTTFHIGSMPVAHGGHFYGTEGGAAIAHMVFLDLIVTEGRLGPTGLRAFLTGISWADERLSPARYRRPLYEWSWSLREQRDMWSWPRAKPWPHRIEWSRAGAYLDLGSGLTPALPHLPGFRLDCVGMENRREREPREVRLYYRPIRGHAPLAVFFCRPTDVPQGRTGRIYRVRQSSVGGNRAVAIRAPSVGSSRVDVDLDAGHLLVNVPAPEASSGPGRDLRIAARFVRAITGISYAGPD